VTEVASAVSEVAEQPAAEESAAAEPEVAETQSDLPPTEIEAIVLEVEALKKGIRKLQPKKQDDAEKVYLKKIVISMLNRKLQEKVAVLKQFARQQKAVKKEKLRQKCIRAFGGESQ